MTFPSVRSSIIRYTMLFPTIIIIVGSNWKTCSQPYIHLRKIPTVEKQQISKKALTLQITYSCHFLTLHLSKVADIFVGTIAKFLHSFSLLTRDWSDWSVVLICRMPKISLTLDQACTEANTPTQYHKLVVSNHRFGLPFQLPLKNR